MNQLSSHSLLRRPKLAKWAGTFALLYLLLTPRAASADTGDLIRGFERVFFYAEVLFPDVRGEWDDHGGSWLVLSWPIPVELLETSDHLAALEVFGEPQLRLNDGDLRLAGGVRGNWNVFDLLGGLDDAGLLAETGGVYDDFPGAFVGGGIGMRSEHGGGVGIVYRRVWTFEEEAPHRHDFCIDFRMDF